MDLVLLVHRLDIDYFLYKFFRTRSIENYPYFFKNWPILMEGHYSIFLSHLNPVIGVGFVGRGEYQDLLLLS